MNCTLCKEPNALRNSHIVPEFLHVPAYDEKHRIGVTARGSRKMRLLQKGIREPLLCDACEALINTQYEQPMSNAWDSLIPQEVERDVCLLDGVDYRTFKLFHLSILWRASVAKGAAWESASIGPRHEEALRRALLTGDVPPRNSYPVLGTVFMGPDSRRPCLGWVMAPSPNRIGAARLYNSLYGGCAWHVVVANHAVVSPENPFVLSERGQLGMLAYDVMKLFTTDIGKQVRFCWSGR